MVLPEMNQPSIQEIEAELGTFKRWQLAYLRNEHPLPDLPIAPDERSTFTLLYGLVVQSVLILLGWIAKLTQLRSLRVWAAWQRVACDLITVEPASCFLNNTFTELGLALLAGGDHVGATECLRQAWRVHPCPHNTSLGLNPRLWRALESVPESTDARHEYEERAKQFSLNGQFPYKREQDHASR